MGREDKLIVPNQRILDAWRLSALEAQPPMLGAFDWPLVVLSLITALEKREAPALTTKQCYCPDCGTLHFIAGDDPRLPYERRREAVARVLAASTMGLVKDPEGRQLPDKLWQQLSNKADAVLFIAGAQNDHEAADKSLFHQKL